MKKRLKIFRTIVAATILLLVPAKIQAQWAQPAEGEGYYWEHTSYQQGTGSGVVTVYKEDSSALPSARNTDWPTTSASTPSQN